MNVQRKVSVVILAFALLFGGMAATGSPAYAFDCGHALCIASHYGTDIVPDPQLSYNVALQIHGLQMFNPTYVSNIVSGAEADFTAQAHVIYPPDTIAIIWLTDGSSRIVLRSYFMSQWAAAIQVWDPSFAH